MNRRVKQKETDVKKEGVPAVPADLVEVAANVKTPLKIVEGPEVSEEPLFLSSAFHEVIVKASKIEGVDGEKLRDSLN